MQVSANDGGNGEFSICVPTYNRAPLLARCLSHLCQFSDIKFEIIIGDNCSTDNTREVVASFADQFPDLKYVLHTTNLGFSRNMDSILRRASRKYIYILSDDDFLFEGALIVVRAIMASQPQVVAVAGRYIGIRKYLSHIDVNYGDAVATILERCAHAKLLTNFVMCDGHPFMRREVFQRHCAYWDRTIGLFPLFMQLLNHGEVMVVDKPFFQHLANQESLTGSMTEAWMLDMANADFEMALSSRESLPLRDQLGVTRQSFLQMMYFQAARMALTRNSYYLMWLFLRRLNAISGAGGDLLVHVEANLMHDIISARVLQVIQDTVFDLVLFDSSQSTLTLVDALKSKLPNTEFRKMRDSEAGVASALHLIAEYDDSICISGPVLVLADIFVQLRLSEFDAELLVNESRLSVSYRDSHARSLLTQTCSSFEILLARYSTDE